MRKTVTIGIDEVGRGALAGPVVLSAVKVKGRMNWRHQELGRIRDSKKLTPKRREMWFRHLASHPRISWQVAGVSPTVIDRINISRAANLGAHRLAKRMTSAGGRCFAWLDGGLVLPQTIPHRTLIKGDESKPIIAAASIMAKVWRDRLMTRLGGQFPEYGFEAHKGYGTSAHRRALRRYGPSEFHRRTFLS